MIDPVLLCCIREMEPDLSYLLLSSSGWGESSTFWFVTPAKCCWGSEVEVDIASRLLHIFHRNTLGNFIRLYSKAEVITWRFILGGQIDLVFMNLDMLWVASLFQSLTMQKK